MSAATAQYVRLVSDIFWDRAIAQAMAAATGIGAGEPGVPDPGLAAATESVKLYQRCQERMPHAFDEELRDAAETLANALARTGRYQEAAKVRHDFGL